MREEETWSELTGLRNAAVRVVLRCLICLPIWIGLYWVACAGLAAVFEALPIDSWRLLIPLSFGALIPGVAIGIAITRRIDEHAGFVHPVVTGVVIAPMWSMLYAGAAVVRTLGAFDGWAYEFFAIGVAIVAAYTTLLDS